MTGVLEAMAVSRPVSRLDALALAVEARLRDRLPRAVTVERFPVQSGLYDMQGREAAVLVLVTGGNFERSPIASRAAVMETVSIVTPVIVRTLSGDAGAPSLIEDVRLALQGVSLAGGSAIQPIGWSLVDRDEETLRFDFEFETRLPAVAGSDHPLRGAP